jgi:ABC-type Zn uptake system ZnuABC Zn-binding protein ZnuA
MKAAAITLVAGACDDDDDTSAAAAATNDRVMIATTVGPITSIVANVVGDRAEIRGIVPEGTSSHTFEPRPSVAARLAGADVVYLNGLQLEEPTRDLADQHLRNGAAIVELGNLTITEDEYIYDFSFPREDGKPNPHLWTDPLLARRYAEIVRARLRLGGDRRDPGVGLRGADAAGGRRPHRAGPRRGRPRDLRLGGVPQPGPRADRA